MKNFKMIALFLFSICFVSNTYSQGNFSIHFGPSFPLSDFGSDDIDQENAGGAAVGINLGLQYSYPLAQSGFGLFAGVDFNYNGLRKDVKDDAEKLYKGMGLSNLDIKFYKYINVPISAGLNYTYIADDKIGVFANAGLALNFLKMTDMVMEANSQTVTTSMDVANNLGFKVGGGILFNKKTTMSIDYFALGKHDIEGKMKALGVSQDLDTEGKVDLLTLTLGFKF